MDQVFETLMTPQPALHLEVRDGAVAAIGQQVYEHSSPVPGGPFLKWSWDGTTLLASNDMFGLLPCFFAETESGFCISTSIRDLIKAGVPAEPDYDALSVMLYFGQFVGNSTPFAGVKALPANARLRWSRAGLQLEGGPSMVKPDPLPRDKAIDAFIDLFSQSMRRHLEQTETFVVPLTGGRDSRHILFEAIKLGRKPEAVFTAEHFPVRGNDDILVAKGVCDELDLPHQALPTRGTYFEAETGKVAPLDWLSMEHVFSLPVLGYLADKNGVAVYDGLAGDVLSAGLSLTPEKVELAGRGDMDVLAKRLGSAWSLNAVLAPAARERITAEAAQSAISTELRRHEDAANPLSSFMFWNRTRRNVALAPYRLMAGFTWPICTPYLTDEIFNLTLSQPPEYFLDHQFHDEAIARAYPEWSAIPYEVKVPRYHAPPSFTRATAFALGRYAPLRKSSLLNRPRLAMWLARSILLPRSGNLWWLRKTLYLAALEHYLVRE